MPQPPTPQRSRLVLDWAIEAAAWMRSTRPIAGPGIQLRSGPSGTIVGQARPARSSDPSPFAPRNIRQVGSSYAVTVQEGWLVEHLTTDDADSILYHEPRIGAAEAGVLLSARPRPELSMADGDIAYLEYHTDDKGAVDTEQDIVISVGSTATATRYLPKNPDDSTEGTAGHYKIKLFALEAPSEGAPLRATIYQHSDVEHYHDLWTGDNTGAAARVFKARDHATDTYQFRSIEGDAVEEYDSETWRRCHVVVTENTDTIKIEVFAPPAAVCCAPPPP